MNLYLVSAKLLLTAVSPVGATAAPAVTAGWTPLSVASFASAGSYTVNSSLLNQHFYSPWFQVFLRVLSKSFSHSSASSGPQSCTQFNLSRVYILKPLGSLPSDWRLSLLVTLNSSQIIKQWEQHWTWRQRPFLTRHLKNWTYKIQTICVKRTFGNTVLMSCMETGLVQLWQSTCPALKFVIEILFTFFVDINCIKCTMMLTLVMLSVSYCLYFIWKA